MVRQHGFTIIEMVITVAIVGLLASVALPLAELTVQRNKEHELRHAFMTASRDRGTSAGPIVTFLSFGFKHGVPLDADLVFDARFLPNPRLWHDVPTLTIMPPKIVRTFADAMMFLLTVPLAEGLEQLQNIGVLPVLFRLP